MSRKTIPNPSDARAPSLVIQAAELRTQLDMQADRGRVLLNSSNCSVENMEHDETRWVQFVREILRRAFSNDQYEHEFLRSGSFGTTHDDPRERFEVLRERIEKRLNTLQSIRERLDLFTGSESAEAAVVSGSLKKFADFLHKDVIEKCSALFDSGHYAEAVERSFKVVRDRLRALTGHERGSEAFGKGRLHITGAIAPHVDEDFNNGVKFLTMAIDMFRNEKIHTSETGVDDPTKATQYLVLSSLAMRLLDGAEIAPRNGEN